MKASSWGWRPEPTLGIWRHGARWMRPFVAAAPGLTLLVLLALFWIVGSTLTTAEGILFDLPGAPSAEGEATDLVALAVPKGRETLVFFDDARYVLGDGASVEALASHLGECAARTPRKTILLLVDRRTPSGELMRLAEVARRSGLTRVLFAQKPQEDAP